VARITRCITLSLDADRVVRRLAAAARTDPNVVKQLGLNLFKDELRAPDGHPRNLTFYEVEALAKVLRQPNLTTQRQVLKAMRNPFIDPVLTSEATKLVGDFYWSAPCAGGDDSCRRQVFISVGRIIEALIMKASGDVKIESGKNGCTPTGDVAQAVYQSSDRKTREVDAVARLY
jgi:hypothetical protein